MIKSADVPWFTGFEKFEKFARKIRTREEQCFYEEKPRKMNSNVAKMPSDIVAWPISRREPGNEMT